MSQSTNFARGLSWTLLGEGVFAASQFGMFVLLARLAGEAALGSYSIGLAIATPLFLLASLHLRPTFVVNTDSRFSFPHFLALRMLGAPLALLATCLWSAAAGHDTQTSTTVALVGVIRFGEFTGDILLAAPMRAEHLRPIGMSRATRGVCLLGVCGSALAAGQSANTALLLGAASGLVVTLTFDLRAAARHELVRPRFAPRTLASLAVLAVPVGLAGACLGLTANMPAYVLEHLEGVEPLARYTAVASVLFISGVVNMAIGSAATPRLARTFEASLTQFVPLLLRVVVVVMALNGCIFFGCMLFGPTYLSLGYGPNFATLAEELNYAGGIAILAGVANVLSQTLVAMKRFKLQLVINVSTTFAGAALAWALIPGFSVRGALAALGAIHSLRVAIYILTVTLVSRTERSSRSAS